MVFDAAVEPEMDLLVVRSDKDGVGCGCMGMVSVVRTSLPQTPTYSMRMITSRGSSMVGIGLSSNLASPGP
jgi:hypothetical protein